MDPCSVTHFATVWRFYAVVVFGGTCAILSFIENIFLFYTLASNSKFRHSQFLYFIFQALCDTVVSMAFILITVIDNIKDYTQSEILARFWWSYYKWLYAPCHIAMTLSIYLLVAAAFEKLLIERRSALKKWAERNRLQFVAVSFLLALLMKGPMVFEIQLLKNGNCTGVKELVVDQTPICLTFLYGTVYKFYLRNVVTVFIPFMLLAAFNAGVLLRTKQYGLRARLYRFSTCELGIENQVRIATSTLAVVVSTYLVTHTLNVVITAWEHIDLYSLLFVYDDFYMYAADLVNILAVLTCFARLPIFLFLNDDIRNAVKTVCPTVFRKKDDLNKTEHKLSVRCSEIDKLALIIALNIFANSRGENLRNFGEKDTLLNTDDNREIRRK